MRGTSTRRSEQYSFARELAEVSTFPRVTALDPQERAFWDYCWAKSVQRAHSQGKRIRRWNENLHVPALTAGTAVAALAPIGGIGARIATAALAVLAAVLNGVINLFRTDVQSHVYGAFESQMLQEGWNFAQGLEPYADNGGFRVFIDRVSRLHATYNMPQHEPI
jgi:hypothetical protein